MQCLSEPFFTHYQQLDLEEKEAYDLDFRVAEYTSSSSYDSSTSGGDSTSGTPSSPTVTLVIDYIFDSKTQSTGMDLELSSPGHLVSLKCSATGKPLPTLSWMFTNLNGMTTELETCTGCSDK